MPDPAVRPGRFSRGNGKDEMASMSFLEHLEELRRRIIYSIAGVGIAFFACFYYADRIFGLMQRPIMEALQRNHMPEKLVYLNPTEPFNMYLRLGSWPVCLLPLPSSSTSCGCSSPPASTAMKS